VKINKDAWNAVTESKLEEVWKKLCPEFVQETEGFENPIANVTETVIEIANRLDLEVSPEDVTELFQSHSQDLSNEDLIEIEEQEVLERTNLPTFLTLFKSKLSFGKSQFYYIFTFHSFVAKVK
jgi:hypothetical protein